MSSLPTKKARKPEVKTHFDRLLQLNGTNPTMKVMISKNSPTPMKAIVHLSKSENKNAIFMREALL